MALSPVTPRVQIRLLIAFWLLFLVRGFFFVATIPLWEGFDEWAHYAVIQNMAFGKRLLAQRGSAVSVEVEASLRSAPRVDGPISRDAYWKLPDSQRWNYEQTMRAMPLEWAKESSVSGPPAYEAQQAPLYYWIFAGVYRLMAGLPFLTRVWMLRLVSLLVASSVVPATFVLARGVFRDGLAALGIVAIVVATPQLMLTISHVSNDCLAVALGALVLVALFRWKEQPRSTPRAALLGVVLGLALLTKVYFLAVLPPLAILTALVAVREKNAGWKALLPMAAAAVIAVGWYVNTWTTTRSLSGEQIDMAASRASLSFLGAVSKMQWPRAIAFTCVSHVWLGNWSFLVARSWMYRYFQAVALLAVAGLALHFVRGKRQPARSDLLWLLGVYACFLAALAYHAARTFQVSGGLGTLGHYLFPMVAAETILVTVGIQSLVPAAARRAVIPAGVICLLALEEFGTFFYAVPYYTGFISHLPSGGLPTLSLAQLRDPGLWLMIQRLSVNKPGFLSPPVMATIWVLFVAATLGLIVLAVIYALFRPTARSSTTSGALDAQ